LNVLNEEAIKGGNKLTPQRWIGAILLPLLCAPVLAACGSASSTPPAGPADGHQATPAATTQATQSAPAEAETAAGAKAAAQTIFELYGGGQYSAVWQDMAPGFRAEVPEATYVGAHQQCQSSGRSYQITSPVLTGSTAVVTVSLAGALASLASEPEVLHYVGGQWLWSPSAQMRAPYKAGSVSAIVQQLKAQGLCQSSG